MEESDEEDEGGVIDEEEIDEEIDDKNLYTRLDSASSNSFKHTWNQIKADHTDISSLIISYNVFQNGFFDWENEGGYIGSNTNVKKLVLFGVGWEEGDDNDEHRRFWRITQQTHFLSGLRENRSIEYISFLSCFNMEWITSLWPFFEHNSNLRQIEFQECQCNSSIITSTLTRCSPGSSLERVMVASNNIYAEMGPHIIAALNGRHNLLELSFHSNTASNRFKEIGSAALVNLRDIIISTSCKLRDLNLKSSGISNDGLAILADAFMANNTLKKLVLAWNESITDEGWSSFFTRLQSTALKEIILDHNSIGDVAITALGGLMANNTTVRTLCLNSNKKVTVSGWRTFLTGVQCQHMKELKLGYNNIGDEGLTELGNIVQNGTALKTLNLDHIQHTTSVGWSGFITALQSSNSALVHLNLTNNKMTDVGVATLAHWLASNTKMKSLNIPMCRDMSPHGWQIFFGLLRNSNSQLEELDMCINNSTTDDMVGAMVDALGSLSSLKSLDLAANRYITTQGWKTLENLLRSPTCMLKKLNLFENSIDDETLATFANALVNNNSLNTLLLGANYDITERGWAQFAKIICDTSNIEATYSSNHTLQQLLTDSWYEQDEEDMFLPQDLVELLNINRYNSPSDAARLKIVQYHPNIDMEPLFEWGSEDERTLKALPFVVAWFDKADEVGDADDVGKKKLSAIYQFAQAMPLMFVPTFHVKEGDKKRKR